MVVYNNINFTLRKASQHLDNTIHQINATTLTVISLPAKFTRAAYEAALSVAARNKNMGLNIYEIKQLFLNDFRSAPPLCTPAPNELCRCVWAIPSSGSDHLMPVPFIWCGSTVSEAQNQHVKLLF
jgi:hypothetical protein